LFKMKNPASLTVALGLVALSLSAAAQNTITVGGKTYILGQDAVPAMQSAPGTQPPQATPAPFSPDRLKQMVAPIALYPDALVSQILIASTYPSQVVEAYQWSQSSKNLSQMQAQQVLQSKPWDPSVQSLVQFPQILERMYQGLDWTEDLGDAFLNQQPDVMEAIQVLRRKAQAAGNLQSSPQQTVTQQGNYVSIDPVDPEVVYPPAYDPTEVYGDWGYGGWYYPPGVYAPWAGWFPGSRALAFGAGVAVGAAWSNGYHADWARGNVAVNNNFYHGTYGTANGPGAAARGANGAVGHYGNTTAAYNRNTGEVHSYNTATGNARSGSVDNSARDLANYNANRGYGADGGARDYGGGGAAARSGGEGFEGLHSNGGAERAASDRGWDSRGASADRGGGSAGSMDRGGGFSGGGAVSGGSRGGGRGGRRR
jgi:hypothetical protein